MPFPFSFSSSSLLLFSFSFLFSFFFLSFSTDVREQLIEQGEATSVVYYKKAVDWLTRGWEFREAGFGTSHPETALAYERLGLAHLKAGKSGGGHPDERSDATEHLQQAVSLLGTARRLACEIPGMGTGTAVHARLSSHLSRACVCLGKDEEAGRHASSVGTFYESEAHRCLRCLGAPETRGGGGGDGGGDEDEDEDEEDYSLVIEQHSSSSQGGAAAPPPPLILPASVGSMAAAEKARTMYRTSVKHYVSALKRAEERRGDTEEEFEEAELRIGTDCIAALKHSVRASATFFGVGSVEVGHDLMRMGKLCATYMWDMRLASESLVQAQQIFQCNNKPKESEKAALALRKFARQQEAARGGGQGGGNNNNDNNGDNNGDNNVVKEKRYQDDDLDMNDPDADWLK